MSLDSSANPTVFAMAAVVQDVQEVAVAAFSQVSCVPAEFTPGNDMFAVPSKLTPHRNISAAGGPPPATQPAQPPTPSSRTSIEVTSGTGGTIFTVCAIL